MSFLLRLCWLTYLLSVCFSHMMQAQRFDLRTYSVGDGLAQSQVFALLEDQRGYLWMGTRGGGLSRFDGQTFRTYSSRDGLINNYILCLHEGVDQLLWIGTDNGLSIFDGQQFVNLQVDSTQAIGIQAIEVIHDSLVWLGTTRGLYRYDGRQMHHVALTERSPHAPVATMLREGDSLWVGHEAGLSLGIGVGEQWQHVDRRQGLPRASITAIARGPQGRLWLGTYAAGIYYQRRTRFDPVPALSEVDIVFDLLFDDEEHLWVGTLRRGAIRLGISDSSMLRLDELEGLPTSHVHALLNDRWGNLWLGTSGGGVSKYYGQSFIHQDRRSGLPARAVYALTEDVDCRPWIGAGEEGLAYHDGQRWRLLSDSLAFPVVKAKMLFSDRNGRLWAGTEGQGLWTQVDSQWMPLPDLQGNFIRDMDQDHQGNHWVATAGGGLVKLYRPRATHPTDADISAWRSRTWTTQTGLSDNRLTAVHIDQRNRVWYAAQRRGIGYLATHRRTPVNLPLPGGPGSNSVRVMIEDAFGFLWIGTAGGGLLRLPLYAEDPVAEVVVYKEKLTSANIYLLVFDEQGQLWIGSETGLDRATLDPDRQIIDIKHVGYAEGFRGVETCRDAVFKDRDGTLWFGTVDGLTQYNPRSSQPNQQPPLISLAEVSLFYTPLRQTTYAPQLGPWSTLKRPVELLPRQNHLSFDFVGINLANPQAVRYQWKLDGWEADWSPISLKSDATYSNLPPGTYTFRVKAANEDLFWSNPITVGPFIIAKPYWQRWWFILSATLSLLLIVFLIFRARINAVRRKAQQTQQRLEIEKHLLEVEQKALRLQMNPHFIFNALNSIQSLIGAQDPRNARYQLAKFAKLMRMVLENSRESRISLSAEIEMLTNYLGLEAFSRGGGFTYEIAHTADIDPDEVLIPPLLIQPFVENAIIHGVAPLKEPGHITVSFSREGDSLCCIVRDNGIGRVRAAQLAKQSSHHQKSTALRVIQERLDLLPTENGQQQGLDIVDLTAADGTATGTEVRVQIPWEGW